MWDLVARFAHCIEPGPDQDAFIEVWGIPPIDSPLLCARNYVSITMWSRYYVWKDLHFMFKFCFRIEAIVRKHMYTHTIVECMHISYVRGVIMTSY